MGKTKTNSEFLGAMSGGKYARRIGHSALGLRRNAEGPLEKSRGPSRVGRLPIPISRIPNPDTLYVIYDRQMQTRRFGRLGWPVSEVGYGMWGMGGWTGSDDAESIASLDRSVALGCKFFDTAWAYGEGKSEQLLAQMLRAHAARAVRRDEDPAEEPASGRRCRTTSSTTSSPPITSASTTEKSLRNLGVRPLDLQQLHVWDDAWAADERLAARGGRSEGAGLDREASASA